jgi:probable F420-dependent oxidoreductase
MEMGAVFPTCDIGNDPVVIRDWAQTAEALGYDYIVTFDHVLGAQHENREEPLVGPYTEKDPFHEPMTLLAYLAGITEKIGLATGVLILPQRQAVLAAKQAAEIDLLSGGRLRLGLGTGWNPVEYESLGMPFDKRGKVLDEQVDVMRRLWNEPLVDYTGDFHRIDRAALLPRPGRKIPLWFGAVSPIPIRRAVREGDGILLGAAPTAIKRLFEKTLRELETAGRDPASFGAEAMVDFSQGAETWGKELEVWREAGGTHLSLRAMDTAFEVVGGSRVGFTGPQAYIDALETFRHSVDWG